jgi:hypothetical protein
MKKLRERKHPRQQIIKFSTIAPGIPEPELASHFMPKWFTSMPAHRVSGEDRHPTAKRCVPLLDVMTAGYIIPLWMDLKVAYPEREVRHDLQRVIQKEVSFEWPTDFHTMNALNRASIIKQKGGPDPKAFFDIDGLNINENIWSLTSPWIITTPPGYSCLYTMPFNHPITNMHFISGIVDTDMHSTMVNFPFVWTSNSWEGLIPSGTPLIQVIPFRRDSFKADIEYLQVDDRPIIEAYNSISTLYEGGYRKKFWERKFWK